MAETLTKRILIVEDELIVAYDLADSLRQMGYAITGIVDTAEVAIERAQQEPPDLVLMDIELRGRLRGTDAAVVMGKLGIPVVYLSAFSDDETLRVAAQTTPYGYLTKPPRIEDIRSTLAIAFAKTEQEHQIQALMAEEKRLNQIKSRFLAMASHDLRTPLTIIMMALEMLKRGHEDLSVAKRQQKLDQIKQAVCNMRSQLEDLLAQEQIEAGELAFVPTPTNILNLCQSVIDEVETATGKPSAIALVCAESAVDCCVDPQLLRCILTNLVSNAVKYSPTGSVAQLIVEPSETDLTLQVIDQGIGIPESFREKLFEPFQRANNVGQIKGTGIGLYIVKAAVARHRGCITVENQSPGTAFKVTLPIAVA